MTLPQLNAFVYHSTSLSAITFWTFVDLRCGNAFETLGNLTFIRAQEQNLECEEHWTVCRQFSDFFTWKDSAKTATTHHFIQETILCMWAKLFRPKATSFFFRMSLKFYFPKIGKKKSCLSVDTFVFFYASKIFFSPNQKWFRGPENSENKTFFFFLAK